MKVYILREKRWYVNESNAPDDDDSWETDELRGVFCNKEKAHKAMEICLRKIKKSRAKAGYITRKQGPYGGFANPIITEKMTDNMALYEISHEYSWGVWSNYVGDSYKVLRGNELRIEEVQQDKLIKRKP